MAEVEKKSSLIGMMELRPHFVVQDLTVRLPRLVMLEEEEISGIERVMLPMRVSTVPHVVLLMCATSTVSKKSATS
jgi:hypothetical protein